MLLAIGDLFSGKFRFIEFGTILPILLGIFCIVRGLLYRKTHRQLKRDGINTAGIISVAGGSYSVAFTTRQGKTYQRPLKAATTNDVYRNGERVEVRYNPKWPKRFTVNGGGSAATPLRYILYILAGITLISLGLYRMLELV